MEKQTFSRFQRSFIAFESYNLSHFFTTLTEIPSIGGLKIFLSYLPDTTEFDKTSSS